MIVIKYWFCYLRIASRPSRCRHVVLVSADGDGYVPPQSARVQMCDASVRDAEKDVPHGQVGVLKFAGCILFIPGTCCLFFCFVLLLSGLWLLILRYSTL